MSSEAQKKPSWGKTIGAFFLSWVTAFVCCVLASMIVAPSLGLGGYSTGGLSMVIVGAICAALYRSRGKLGAVCIGAAVVGAAIGLIAALIGAQMVSGTSASKSASVPDDRASQSAPADTTDYLNACKTEEARAVLQQGRDESGFDKLDPTLQKVSFGRAVRDTNSKVERYVWALPVLPGEYSDGETVVHSEEAAMELEAIATAQMAGGFAERDAAYVGEHHFRPEGKEAADGAVNLGIGDEYAIAERYYVIDGEWWGSVVKHWVPGAGFGGRDPGNLITG